MIDRFRLFHMVVVVAAMLCLPGQQRDNSSNQEANFD